MLEDKLLVLKCRRGSKDAMGRIYEKYKDYLFTLAKALLNEKTVAEDTVHDVFVSFARSAKEFRLTGSLRGYLATCVANRARDRLRAEKRGPESINLQTPAVSDAKGPQQNAIEAEELVQLRKALKQLPHEHRQVVVLYIKGRMKFREIAKLEGASISTIHGRYRHGIDKLRSMLNSELIK